MIRSKTLARTLWSMVAEDKRDPEKTIRDFEAFIIRFGLKAQMTAVCRYLEQMAEEDARERACMLKTPERFSERLTEEIRRFIDVPESANTVHSLETNLIGGFVARYNGREYDASLKGQLARLRETLRDD